MRKIVPRLYFCLRTIASIEAVDVSCRCAKLAHPHRTLRFFRTENVLAHFGVDRHDVRDGVRITCGFRASVSLKRIDLHSKLLRLKLVKPAMGLGHLELCKRRKGLSGVRSLNAARNRSEISHLDRLRLRSLRIGCCCCL